MAAVEVSEVVRGVALAHGAVGRRWLAELDGRVADLAERWELTIGAAIEGGTASWVAEVTRADGTPAVLKVGLSIGEFWEPEHAIKLLQVADGRGCVRLLDHDLALGSLLLERLGGQLHDQGLSARDQIDAMLPPLAALWAVPIDGIELPTLGAKAPWFARMIEERWSNLGGPCPRSVIDRALTYVERRAAGLDAANVVLSHGDAHPWNTLVDPAGGYRLVDPDGLLGEPEYDLAILMRELTAELLAGDALAIGLDRARYLARQTGLDEQRIWEWGYIERVSTGLLCLRDAMDQAGRECLDVADAWSAVPL